MTTPRPVTVWEREQLDLGLLDAAAEADVRARLQALGTDPFDHLPSDAQVFTDDPPDAFVRTVQARAAEGEWTKPAPRRNRWQMAGVALSIAVALIAIDRASLPTPPDPDKPPGDIIIKGIANLIVFRQADKIHERLTAGDEVHKGDKLQLAFQAAGHRYGLLFSVDGRGHITEHHRFSGNKPIGEVVLDEAYVLDDAPKFEVFHMVLSNTEFDPDALLASARRRGATEAPPVVPEGAEVQTLPLVKRR